jgi:hypothetical protein
MMQDFVVSGAYRRMLESRFKKPTLSQAVLHAYGKGRDLFGRSFGFTSSKL